MNWTPVGDFLTQAAQTANNYSPLIQALVTFILVIITSWYARANWRLVTEMKETREQTLRPVIVLYSKVEPRPHLFIAVRNMGQGPAKNVRFNFEQELVREDGVKLSQYGPFSAGIAFLPPQQEYQHWYGVTRDLGRRKTGGESLTCSGLLEYDAVYFEKHYSEPFTLDLSIYTHLHENPFESMGAPSSPTNIV